MSTPTYQGGVRKIADVQKAAVPPLSYKFTSMMYGIIGALALISLAFISWVQVGTDKNAIGRLDPGNGLALSEDGRELVLRYIPAPSFYGNRFRGGAAIPADVGPWPNGSLLTSGQDSQLVPAPAPGLNAVLGVEGLDVVWSGAATETPSGVATDDFQQNSTGIFSPEYLTQSLSNIRFLSSNIRDSSSGDSVVRYWMADMVFTAEPNYETRAFGEGQLEINISQYIPTGWAIRPSIPNNPTYDTIVESDISIMEALPTPSIIPGLTWSQFPRIQGSRVLIDVRLNNSATITGVVRLSASISVVAPLQRVQGL